MLWCYVHRDGEWLGIDESRLRYDDFDLADGFALRPVGAAVLVATGNAHGDLPARGGRPAP